MKLAGMFSGFPLLRRELTELANRRRTYVIRLVTAIAVQIAVLLIFRNAVATYRQSGGGVSPLGFSNVPWGRGGATVVLGVGAVIFPAIVNVLFYAIQILMPGLCCGSITMEKERNTLGTLLLTRLSPTTIVLEKLGSRLVPMFTFLLLTFPVLAFVYSLGGVDSQTLFVTLWLLLCECLLYASVAIMCSSWFTTTINAFICSYILCSLPLVLTAMSGGRTTLAPHDIWHLQQGMRPPGLLSAELLGFLTRLPPRIAATWGSYLLTVPALLTTFVCVGIARFFLVRRAFVSSSSLVLRLFKSVDLFFVRLNQRTTRGIVIVADSDAMPLFDPVAWRERTKKSLGKVRYLFRILVAVELPIACICVLTATASAESSFEALHVLLIPVWILTALILGVKAATLVSSERSRETLHALLSTPLTAGELLRQKVAGMHRLMIVMSIPILTVHATLGLLLFELNSIVGLSLLSVYVVLSVLATGTLMYLLSWVCVLSGLFFHSQGKSVVAALATVSVWCLLAAMLQTGAQMIILPGLSPNGMRTAEPSSLVLSIQWLFLSPAPWGAIVLNEHWLNTVSALQSSRTYDSDQSGLQQWLIAGGAFAVTMVHLTMALCIRWLAIRCAPRLFGRKDQDEPLQASRNLSVATPGQLQTVQ